MEVEEGAGKGAEDGGGGLVDSGALEVVGDAVIPVRASEETVGPEVLVPADGGPAVDEGLEGGQGDVAGEEVVGSVEVAEGREARTVKGRVVERSSGRK